MRKTLILLGIICPLYLMGADSTQVIFTKQGKIVRPIKRERKVLKDIKICVVKGEELKKMMRGVPKSDEEKKGWVSPDINATWGDPLYDNRTPMIQRRSSGELILCENGIYERSGHALNAMAIHRSIDRGMSWEPLLVLFVYHMDGDTVWDDIGDPVIAVDPVSDNIYFALHVDAGSGYYLSVYVGMIPPTMDEIQHWQNIREEGNDDFTAMIVCEYKYSNNYIFVAYNSSKSALFTNYGISVWLSTTQGASWNHCVRYQDSPWTSTWSRFCTWGAIGGDGSTNYVCFSYIYAGGVWNPGHKINVARTINRGTTWEELETYENPDADLHSTEIAASKGGMCLVLASQAEFAGRHNIIYAYSDNMGTTWHDEIIDGGPHDSKTPGVAVDGMGATEDTIYGYFRCAYWDDGWTFYKQIKYDQLGVLWVTPPWSEGNKQVSDGPFTIDANWAQTNVGTLVGVDGNWYPIVAWTDTRNPSGKDIYCTVPYPAVCKLIVEPDQTSSTLPGVTKDYTLWIKNRGNWRDIIDIDSIPGKWDLGLYKNGSPLIDNNGDGMVDIDTLYGEDSTFITVKVTPPESLLAGVADTAWIYGMYADTIARTYNGYDSAFIITYIDTVAGIIVDPDQQKNTDPGVPVYYNIWVINNGNARDSIPLTIEGTHWTVELFEPDTTTSVSYSVLDPYGGRKDLIVKVTPPSSKSDTIEWRADTTYIVGNSTNITGVSDNARLITNLYFIGNIIVEPNDEKSGDPGTTVSYQLWVKNKGNFKDVIDIDSTHTQSGWGLELYASDGTTPLVDNNGDAYVDIDSLDRSDSTRIWAKISIPDSTFAGEVDTAIITGMYARAMGCKDSAILITTVDTFPGLGIIVEPDDSTIILPGDSVFYRLWVVNHMNFSDSINIIDTIITEPAGWEVTLFESDTLTPFPAHTFLQDYGKDTTIIIAKVKAPAFNKGEGHSTMVDVNITKIIGTSRRLPTVTDDATLKTTMEYLIGLVIYEDPQYKTANPGSTVTYTLRVKNIGQSDEIITLGYENSAPGWSATLSSYQLYLRPQEFGQITVSVSVPDDEQADVCNTTTITGRSVICPAVKATACLHTTVGAIAYGLFIYPSGHIEVKPGIPETYPNTARLETNKTGGTCKVKLKCESDIPDGWNIGLPTSIDVPCNGDTSFDVTITAPDIDIESSWSEINKYSTSCTVIVHGEIDTAQIGPYRTDSDTIIASMTFMARAHNFPSPFNKNTQFIYSLPPEGGTIDITIYDRLGRKVKHFVKDKSYTRGGIYISEPWNGEDKNGDDVAPGVYIYYFKFKGSSGKIEKIIGKTARAVK